MPKSNKTHRFVLVQKENFPEFTFILQVTEKIRKKIKPYHWTPKAFCRTENKNSMPKFGRFLASTILIPCIFLNCLLICVQGFPGGEFLKIWGFHKNCHKKTELRLNQKSDSLYTKIDLYFKCKFKTNMASEANIPLSVNIT